MGMVLLLVFVISGIPLISQAEKAVSTPPKEKAIKEQKTEKAPVEKAKEIKATLTLVPRAGGGSNINLINMTPVRGIQFTVKGVKLTEVRTTPRTKGFFSKFNEQNGIVIIASFSPDEIAPGEGIIAEIIYTKVKGAEASLSDIKMVGKNREEL